MFAHSCTCKISIILSNYKLYFTLIKSIATIYFAIFHAQLECLMSILIKQYLFVFNVLPYLLKRYQWIIVFEKSFRGYFLFSQIDSTPAREIFSQIILVNKIGNNMENYKLILLLSINILGTFASAIFATVTSPKGVYFKRAEVSHSSLTKYPSSLLSAYNHLK